ncbi:hypothetical protein A2T76_17695 [Pseudomonas brenneri]|nr:hypothetical protein A2T76_17695 [Pseudomonas brenneri]
MNKDREVALEQALIAVIAAAEQGGVDVQALLNSASALIIGHSPFRRVEHPHVTMACQEISEAHATVLTLKS